MTGLSITNIHKSYESTPALNGVSFNIQNGEIFALLGPSGCGKSTLLNIIAGLETPDKGDIAWNGKSLAKIPPHKRGMGLMFQDYLLFPHKNVAANITFGLEMAQWPKKRIDFRLRETLKTVNLQGYAQRDINTLSGGEQQRVALARSLAPQPILLMLDEPLGALDRTLRESLLHELGIILRSMEQTALYVTHDQEEAFMLADRVIVMEQGRAVQIGTPQMIYRHPATGFVARFLGLGNIIEGQYRDGCLQTVIGEFQISRLPEMHTDLTKSSNFQILFRPDAVYLDGRGTHKISAKVLETQFRGSTYRLSAQIKETTLTFEFPAASTLPQAGNSVNMSFYPEDAFQILS